MTKKKKIVIGVFVLVLVGLLFFEGRRITFSIECLLVENELEKNYFDNKPDFFELAKFVENTPSLEFDFYSGDSIYMKFQDSSIYYVNLFIDSVYSIKSETKSEFLVDEKGCLVIIDYDTIKICNNNWQVQFYGHYKNKKIDQLLGYYGWTRQDFEKLIEKVKGLNCYSFKNSKNDFELGYKIVSYYNDRIFHCFGHPDGYFDYLYTSQPESIYWQSSLKKFGENYYGIEHWNF